MNSPSRAAIVATARESIARGSKSFALASRLFDRETRERAWLLYAWCRRCDDLADGQDHGHQPSLTHPVRVERSRDTTSSAAENKSLGFARRSPSTSLGTNGAGEVIAHIRDLTKAALAGHTTGDPAFDALGIVASECPIPRQLIDDHIEGFALDAAGWRPRSEADMIRYCYHVAGAVGRMMAVAMGVSPDDDATLDRAGDLGIAFQLANIARDMSEDDAVGRCYLPEEWLAEMDVPPGQHMKPNYRDRMGVLVKRLAAMSEGYEASGRAGAARLPFRARWAVLAAAGIYGDIARECGRRGSHAWDYRVVTSGAAKLGWVVRAFGQALARPPAPAASAPPSTPPGSAPRGSRS